jgi:serine/threonine-protein kinase
MESMVPAVEDTEDAQQTRLTSAKWAPYDVAVAALTGAAAGPIAHQFGRYTLLSKIAEGGMASVHLGQLRGDYRFQKWVAVKVVHPRHAGNDRFVRMFLNEARLVARIDHPNVCTVFDFGEVNGIFYIAMEYLFGQGLFKVLLEARKEAGRVPFEIAARIIADAAEGLHAAHELLTEDGQPAGVVHRDVSPQNIFVLYSGGTKVVDFGIARSNDRGDEEFTTVGEIKGKLSYMSPEQLNQRELDRRSDVFSLGIVLWELVCRQRLFKRKSDGETVNAVLNDEIRPPTAIDATIPKELDRICMRALARDPAERYQTAADLAHDLEQFIAAHGMPAGHAQVAAVMKTLFAADIEEHTTTLKRKYEILRRIKESPELEVELQIEPSLGTPITDPESLRPRRRNRTALVAVVLAVAGAVAVAATLMRRPSQNLNEPPRGSVAPAAPAAVEPPPAASPTIEAPPPAKAAPETPAETPERSPAKASTKPGVRRPATKPAPAAHKAVSKPEVKPKADEGEAKPHPMTEFE